MEEQLHVLLFPLQAFGHMIPIRDMAKLFASRNVKTTILTTPLNAHIFTKTAQNYPQMITLRILKFPAVEAGLPQDFECLDHLTSDQMIPKFTLATNMLREQVEQLLEEIRPNCLIADMFYPWATDSAAKFNIPRLVFHGTGFFALCVTEQINLHMPYKTSCPDFVVPNLPHAIKLTRQKMPRHIFEDNATEFTKLITRLKESEERSYGAIVNSFYELEPDYADFYRNIVKRNAWHIGPVSLCNRQVEDKVQRGKAPSITKEECLKWLDSKSKNSVIYVCFGSVADFTNAQLREIAMGLEGCGHHFIWVIGKKNSGDQVNEDEWMPKEFEENIGNEGKALIIWGWAPQLLILEHESIGGFVTHCGWNSVLEAVSVGVPMVTWPVFAEQFYNEKLVTEVLRIGVAVGSEKHNRVASGVGMEAVEKAVRRVMAGKEAEEIRDRVDLLKDKARNAVGEGGSSYLGLDDLLKKLRSRELVKRKIHEKEASVDCSGNSL